jgi:hypothetical protein
MVIAYRCGWRFAVAKIIIVALMTSIWGRWRRVATSSAGSLEPLA